MFPTFDAFQDASKFFIDVKNDDGDPSQMMVNLRKACVVVNVPCLNGTVAHVAFFKTSRSKNYRDSRSPKKYLTAKEVKDELQRMLQDSHQADQAFRALQV